MFAFRSTVSPTTLAVRLNIQLARASTAAAQPRQFKGIKDTPSPKGLPILGNSVELAKAASAEILFRRSQEMHKQFGKIYRERVLGLGSLVLVSDPELAEVAYRSQDAEATYPRRGDMSSWIIVREELGEGDGIVTAENEEWKRMRAAFNKKMLRVQEVGHFASMVNETVTDLIKRIEYIQRQQPGQLTIPNLANELYRFAFETVSYALFQRRLGCMEPTIPASTQLYIDSIAIMMRETGKLFLFPHLHKRLRTSTYKKSLDAWRTIFATARRLVDDKVAVIKEKIKTGKIDEPVDIVTHVILTSQINEKEIYSNFSEILLAGVDTTSNSLVWLMYELAANHDAQKTLREEIESVVGDRVATADDVKRLSYLKCCVKEVLRMYPVVPTNGRILKSDVVLGDYLIPKGTQIGFSHWTMSRSDEIFPEANRFIPERWLRDNKGSKADTFATMPFGFGVRACLGRRLAEMELQLATIRIIQTFDLERDGYRLLIPVERGVLAPLGEVPVRFCPRKTVNKA